MAFIQCSFYSHTLGMETNANIILPHGRKNTNPNERKTDIPTLYLFHGLTEDYTAWTRRTSIERYVMDKNIAVVMPNVHRSFCADAKYGLEYFKFVSEELTAVMRNMFALSDKREDNFTAGLSMGGYCALKLALRCPEKFCAAASLSGAVNIERVLEDKEHLREVTAVFDGEIKDDDNLYYLAENAAPMPSVYQSCGTKDFLYTDNVKFSELMTNINKNYVYYEEDGASHTWDFWDREIQKVIKWLGEINRKINM